MEVTKKNFEAQIAELLNALPKAKFMAIDLEFTGLPKDQATVTDTPMEVYHKAITCANYNNIIQIGITCFTPEEQPAQLAAHSYCFYIFPSTYGGKVNQKISMEVSSIEFNRDNGGVDFGKWITEGVPYYNRKLQAQLRRCFDNDRAMELNIAFRDKEPMDKKSELSETKDGSDKPAPEPYENPVKIFDEKERENAMAEVAKFKAWAADYEVGKTFEFTCPKGIFKQHFWNEIRNSFGCEIANVIIEERSTESSHSMLFTMATQTDKEQFLKKIAADLEERFQKELGFSRYWEKITGIVAQNKIPVIFHQGMLDCMYVYSHFENWCPLNFGEFKKTFNTMFPVVYDTKNLARQVDTDANHLEGLYNFVSAKNGFDPAAKYPIVNKDPTTHSKTAHNAGWDSYMTGVVFSELQAMIGDISKSRNHVSLFKNKYFNMSFGDDKFFYLDDRVLVFNTAKEGEKGKAGKSTEKKGKRDRRDDTSRDKLRGELTTMCQDLGCEARFTLHRQNEPEVIGNSQYLFLTFEKPLTQEQTELMAGKLKDQYEIRTVQDYHQMVYNNFQQTVYGAKN